MKHYSQNQCLNPRCALEGKLDERSVSMLEFVVPIGGYFLSGVCFAKIAK